MRIDIEICAPDLGITVTHKMHAVWLELVYGVIALTVSGGRVAAGMAAGETIRDYRRANVFHEETLVITYTVLSLVPHPEFYEGPVDPDWARFLRRLAIKMRAEQLRVLIVGWRREVSPTMYDDVHARDYALARALLEFWNYDYLTACEIAMLATREYHASSSAYVPLFNPL